MNFTAHWAGITAVAIFFIAYLLVILEETIHLKKSKPVMVAAGLIWAARGDGAQRRRAHRARSRRRFATGLLEFAELFLFLLAAMTYINTMDERGVFDALRARLVSRGYSLRQIFWITGGLAFVMSPVADNLTTALLMATVAMAVGGDEPPLRRARVHQHRRRRERGRRVQPVRRHHHADGLAARAGRVPAILHADRAVARQLARHRGAV